MRSKLLIVDDELGPRESLRMILKDKYDLTIVEDGKQALDHVIAEDVDLVLMDIKMPRMTGIEALQAIKAQKNDVEVLILTGYGSLDTAIRAMQHGAYDYVTKPFDKDDILRLVDKGLLRRSGALQLDSHKKIIEELTQDLKKDYVDTLVNLIQRLEVDYAGAIAHGLRVAHLAFHLGLSIGKDTKTLQQLRHAGLLHDMGKALPDLTSLEHHPLLGAMILRDALGQIPMLSWIEQHHEKLNGSGYPLGLKNHQISKEASILIIVNVFDNLIYPPFPGKEAPLAFQEALVKIQQHAGQEYDSELCRHLITIPQLESLWSEHERQIASCDLASRFQLELSQVRKSDGE